MKNLRRVWYHVWYTSRETYRVWKAHAEAFYLYLYEWTQWLGTGLREDLQSVHAPDKTATSWIETRSRE
jgi:hypothetical protein